MYCKPMNRQAVAAPLAGGPGSRTLESVAANRPGCTPAENP
jgi:hypothetical protein